MEYKVFKIINYVVNNQSERHEKKKKDVLRYTWFRSCVSISVTDKRKYK